MGDEIEKNLPRISEAGFKFHLAVSRRDSTLTVLLLVSHLPKPLLSLMRRHFVAFALLTTWHEPSLRLRVEIGPEITARHSDVHSAIAAHAALFRCWAKSRPLS